MPVDRIWRWSILNHVAWVLAAHHGTNNTVGRTSFRKACRGLVEVERNGCRKHLDVADFFGCRMKQHVTVFRSWTASAPGLEEVLHANSDFAFDAADGLLEHAGKDWVGRVDLNWIL